MENQWQESQNESFVQEIETLCDGFEAVSLNFTGSIMDLQCHNLVLESGARVCHVNNIENADLKDGFRYFFLRVPLSSIGSKKTAPFVKRVGDRCSYNEAPVTDLWSKNDILVLKSQ